MLKTIIKMKRPHNKITKIKMKTEEKKKEMYANIRKYD